MAFSEIALPAGIGLAAVCALAAVGLVLRSRRSLEQDKLSAEEREALAKERRESWRRRLAVISLGVSFVIIFCIAGIAAWLSFGAQKAYAFDRNGGSWDAAMGFALLLDAGALGLSLMRLFEALTARSSQLTRLYLVAFVVASATMNLLHAPRGEAPSFGGRLVAVIPPLVYAIFLETLLKKVEQLVMGKYPKKKERKSTERGYSLLLWVPLVGYPWKMWKAWRADLHATIQYVRAPGSRTPLPVPQQPEQAPAEESAVPVSASPSERPAHQTPDPVTPPRVRPVPAPAVTPAQPTLVAAPEPAVNVPPVRTAALPAPAAQGRTKKEQLFAALVEQIRQGDLRVFDNNAQVSNAAAYRANKLLGQEAGQADGLMKDGAVRTAVKQLLPELQRVRDEVARDREMAAARPESRAQSTVHEAATNGDVREAPSQHEVEVPALPVIGPQRAAEEGAETKEVSFA